VQGGDRIKNVVSQSGIHIGTEGTTVTDDNAATDTNGIKKNLEAIKTIHKTMRLPSKKDVPGLPSWCYSDVCAFFSQNTSIFNGKRESWKVY